MARAAMSFLVLVILTSLFWADQAAEPPPNRAGTPKELSKTAGLGSAGWTDGPAVHEDGRCRCVCPNPKIVNATHSERKLYIQSVLPSECDCVNVVLSQIMDSKASTQSFEQLKAQFCPRCSCKYERRKTKLIQIVVFITIGVISSLSIYCLFLVCLDPWLKNTRPGGAYSEHLNEEISLQRQPFGSRDSNSSSEVFLATSGPRARDSVLHRVGQQQSKWQRTVQQQRKNIYDNRTLLN